MSFVSHYPDRSRREQARLVAIATAWALAPAVQAESLPYQLDRQHTQVHWEVKHFGTSTSRGRFDTLAGQLRFDRETGLGEVSVTVDTASVTSGVPVLDGVLRGEDFLASSRYPTAYFVSRRFRTEQGRVVALDGELTLRDQSLPFTLTAIRFGCYPHPTLGREVCGGDFEGTLKRQDYGITYGLPLLANAVRLVVQVEAIAP